MKILWKRKIWAIAVFLLKYVIFWVKWLLSRQILLLNDNGIFFLLFIFLKILGGEVEKSELTFKTKLVGEKLGEKRGWYNGVVR